MSNALANPHLLHNDEYSYGIDVQIFNGSGGAFSVGDDKVIIDYVWYVGPEFY